jgi:hypothetical protein
MTPCERACSPNDSMCCTYSHGAYGLRASGRDGRIPARSNAPIVLFNGPRASPGDVAVFRRILANEHLDHSIVDSPQLNS